MLKQIAIFGLALGTSVLSRGALIFTIEDPGVQQSSVPGAVTETFDDFDLLSAIGTYSGGSVELADQYGGAGGSPYFFQPAGSSASLTFNSPQTYFGVWWSAGDGGNVLNFYDPLDVLIGSYTVFDISAGLSPGYFGNPNTGENVGEPYVYLNFTGVDGTLIQRVVFDNPGGGGFETDNHSIFDQPIDPPGNALPEGGGTALLLISGLAILRHMRAKR